MFWNILDIHPCVECDCMCSWSVISSTNNPCEGIPWLSTSVQKLVNLVKLEGKLPRLWCPLCVLLTPLGHQRNDWNFLHCCLHMNTVHWTVTMHCRLMSPGSLALITENPVNTNPTPEFSRIVPCPQKPCDSPSYLCQTLRRPLAPPAV